MKVKDLIEHLQKNCSPDNDVILSLKEDDIETEFSIDFVEGNELQLLRENHISMEKYTDILVMEDEILDQEYIGSKFILKREGHLGRWYLREKDSGIVVDSSQFRDDIAERHNLDLQ